MCAGVYFVREQTVYAAFEKIRQKRANITVAIGVIDINAVSVKFVGNSFLSRADDITEKGQ